MSCSLFNARGVRSAGDEDRERVACAPRANRHLHVLQSSCLEEPVELLVFEPEPAIAESFAYPVLVVTPQVQNEHTSARTHDAHGFRQRHRGIVGVMQCLRQERHVDTAVLERQFFQLAPLPLNVRAAPPSRELLRARKDGLRPIHGNHLAREAARFERQVAFAAPEIRHVHGREELPERARPRGPAPPGHDLAALFASPVFIEVLLAEPPHLLEPRIVGAPGRGCRGGRELLFEERP
jgi:hypothetical protein